MKADPADPILPDPSLPARDPLGHKGSFGTVAVVGGCVSDGTMMIGAPALAAIGALRAGTGLVRLVCPEGVLGAALTVAPSATGLVLPTDNSGCIIPHEAAEVLDAVFGLCDAIALGPGLGDDVPNRRGVEAVVLRVLHNEVLPVVVDADAINVLAHVPGLVQDFRAPAILTPHPGEFRRLAQPLRISLDPTDPAQRPAAAQAMAQKLGCVVVLKGAGTIVTDGYRTWVCPRGHACLGTAGTGDVLTGVLAGLLGQAKGTQPDLFEIARAGVFIHALAGEHWARQARASGGLLAPELAGLIPACVESLRDQRH